MRILHKKATVTESDLIWDKYYIRCLSDTNKNSQDVPRNGRHELEPELSLQHEPVEPHPRGRQQEREDVEDSEYGRGGVG